MYPGIEVSLGVFLDKCVPVLYLNEFIHSWMNVYCDVTAELSVTATGQLIAEHVIM